MVLGKKCESIVNRANEGYGVGLVRSTSFGRKRVALSNINLEFDGHNVYNLTTPTKRQCYENSILCSDKYVLEALPQDVLIRILCGVEHDDLKRLVLVSKSIRDATLIAKRWHFAYSTPRKTVGFQNVEDMREFNDIEAPNAPKQSRVPRSRLSSKKLAAISVALFAFGSGDN
ncbi:F-box protein SKIP27-like [Olea europaea var. sylvestris]|uniref:F-box protein SKIP27-like n=1 Tax=Olea europaea var. sylvestris TaxID=158386 RepID=UPI000C1D3AC4|nr:F-box protein SKIP27-like [Olea europaea var. sylvestris]